ncbi:hypothetical protein M1555_04950 [Patescibacteria group bacterium]|nr:hypothetical protein [Patescibacteria group bacterium]
METLSTILSGAEYQNFLTSDFDSQRITRWLLRKGGAEIEYLNADEWVNEPDSPPDDERAVLLTPELMGAVNDVRSLWQTWRSLSYGKPIDELKILSRLLSNRISGNDQVLYVPWGSAPGVFRLDWKEEKVMEKITGIASIAAEYGISTRVLIMPADVYALVINKREPNEVIAYYYEVAALAARFGFDTRPWSEIRSDNSGRYAELKEYYSDKRLRSCIPDDIIEQAIGQAARWSGYASERDIKRAAFSYLRERNIEAQIIDEQYAAIKVSAVPKAKDAYVDDPLPRLYVIDKELQFPWLRPSGNGASYDRYR